MAHDTHPILVGCSSWSYADWEGPFIPEGTRPADFLEYYADRFPIVEIDSSFYRPPTPKMARSWYDRTPEDFKFAAKVPRSITHEKQLRDCGAEVDEFVASLRPLREKLLVALLQMGYFNRGMFGSLEEFLETLDAFLATWPHDRIPLAVEIRNPRWVGEPLAQVLRAHNAALTLTEQKWMPRPAQVAEQIDPVTGPLSFIRLMGDREAIEKVTTTWDRIVLDRSAELEETAGVIRDLARRVPVVAFASNHFAGFAPETARQLQRLLGIPEPTPPQRPRTTLFD